MLDKKDNHSNNNPIDIFCSYASEDEPLFSELKRHLSLLERQKAISLWHEGESSLNKDLFRDIEQHFQQAHVILLLITSNFIGSNRCRTVMDMALHRGKVDNVRVIPIIMSNVDLEDAPFAHLKLLPRDGRPVSDKSWSDRDEAFVDIVQGIRQSIKELRGSLPKKALAQQASSIHRQRLLKRMYAKVENLMEQSFGKHRPATLRLREELSKEENLNWPSQVLLDNTEIKTVYEDAEEQLLILGGPGSGKTTLLLQLACTLLENALNNKTNQIPIMLNLVTWEKDLSFTEWLQHDLGKIVSIPNHVVESWTNANELILLLDGLDNIPNKDKRDACVKAINEYQNKHDNLVSMVVTSRPLDRLEPTETIKLFKTIVVEPLDSKQIDDYITSASKKPDILREELSRDSELSALAAIPLVLNIMIKVYEESSIITQRTENTGKQLLQKIFDEYVKYMIDRKSVLQYYKPQQIKKSLTWIAKQMVQHSQSIFLMQQIDESWLSNFSSYTSITSILIIILFGAVFCLFPFTFVGQEILAGWITIPIIIFASIFTLSALIGKISWGSSVIPVTLLLILALILILSGLFVPLSLIVGIILIFCLWIITFMGKISLDITIFMSFFLLISTIGSIITSFIWRNFVIFLLFSMCVIFVLSLISSLFTFYKSKYRSKLFFISCLGFVLSIGGLFFLPSFALSQSVPGEIVLRIATEIFLFVEVVWFSQCMNRLILRWFLHKEGSIPWNYSHFLNSMVDCNMLRKDNHGYIFAHELLRNYFFPSNIP